MLKKKITGASVCVEFDYHVHREHRSFGTALLHRGAVGNLRLAAWASRNLIPRISASSGRAVDGSLCFVTRLVDEEPFFGECPIILGIHHRLGAIEKHLATLVDFPPAS